MTEDGAIAGPPGAVRAFTAIALPDDVREAVARLQAKLVRTGVRFRWVPAANFHLTLLFVGPLGADDAPRYGKAFAAAANDLAPIELTVRGAGFFGAPRAPRVLWAGLAETPPALVELERRLRRAAEGFGWRGDERPYHPHITLARSRPGVRPDALLPVIRSTGDQPCGTFRATSFQWMKSTLRPEGAVYETMTDVQLKGVC